jgi:hypothetical protein
MIRGSRPFPKPNRKQRKAMYEFQRQQRTNAFFALSRSAALAVSNGADISVSD